MKFKKEVSSEECKFARIIVDGFILVYEGAYKTSKELLNFIRYLRKHHNSTVTVKIMAIKRR